MVGSRTRALVREQQGRVEGVGTAAGGERADRAWTVFAHGPVRSQTFAARARAASGPRVRAVRGPAWTVCAGGERADRARTVCAAAVDVSEPALRPSCEREASMGRRGRRLGSD